MLRNIKLSLLVLILSFNFANAQIVGPNPFTGSATPSGPAGGDLTGTYPNPSLASSISTSVTWAGNQVFNTTGAASSSPILFTGEMFTGGTGTTTFPYILRQRVGTTAVTTWTPFGTHIGINASSGFAGNFLDFHIDGGVSLFSVTSTGSVVVRSGTLTSSQPALALTQTWNNGATVFDGLTINITDTSSSAISRLANLQVGGSSKFSVSKGGTVSASGNAIIQGGTAIPAGGTAGAGYKFSSTSDFGVFFGSGAPTLSAAKGSLYLRSDGSTTNDRAYINTDGGTTWTAVITAL